MGTLYDVLALCVCNSLLYGQVLPDKLKASSPGLVLQVVGDYWERGIAYFTYSIYMAIAGCTSGGGSV